MFAIDARTNLVPNLGHINIYTATIGGASLAFLFWVRRGLKPLLRRFGVSERAANVPFWPRWGQLLPLR